MAKPFKKKIVRYARPDGTRCAPDAPDAVRRDELSLNYYGNVPQPGGGRKAVPLCPDLSRSKTMLNRLLSEAAMARVGLGDPYADHRKKPLAEHLDDWEADLLARKRTGKHAALSANRARRVAEACKFRMLGDLSASAVQAHIGEMSADGSSVSTCNHHLTAIKGFARWLVKDRRMGDSPLAHLSGGNAATDKRHERRDLADDEVARLLEAARRGPARCGLAGIDRAMLYSVALRTGLRASELASLTPASFALECGSPSVTVEAAYAKNRREDMLPVHPDLARALRPWIAGKPASAPLWPGNWARLFKGGKMMQAELALARAIWIAEAEDAVEQERRKGSDFLAYRDGQGRVIDFHALRHTFISTLARSGVSPKVAQTLARHSTITLTMDRYTHVGLHDVASAMQSLPALPDAPARESQELRATGTSGLGCTLVAQNPAIQGHPQASHGIVGGITGEADGSPQPHTVSALVVPRHPEASVAGQEAPPGFEPGMADLQSAALPLGEGASLHENDLTVPSPSGQRRAAAHPVAPNSWEVTLPAGHSRRSRRLRP